MKLRSIVATTIAAVGLAAAAFAPAASAGDVGFSLSFGGPGYGVAVGNYGFYPAPVYVAPAPYAPVYRPYYYDPVVVYPRPVYRPYRYYGSHARYDRDNRWRHRDGNRYRDRYER